MREDSGDPSLMGNCGRSFPEVTLLPASLGMDPERSLHSKDGIRTPRHQTTAILWPRVPLPLTPFFICAML